jgi:bifunctional NMN adenylyltransferase/nudix hydrolase
MARAKTKKLSVIIGRFQTPMLHEGHRALIKYAMDKGDKLLVILGVNPAGITDKDPLDFACRLSMMDTYLSTVYKQRKDAKPFHILAARDQPSDALWSHKIDELIQGLLKTHYIEPHKVTLYGGRDSFIPHYRGSYATQYLPKAYSYKVNASQIRKDIGELFPPDNATFRQGIIYASESMFPTSYQVVDVAILGRSESVLLGRKNIDGGMYRFPGGFVDPTDSSLAMAAKREAKEETGIDVYLPRYIDSYRVKDYRYRSTKHKIMTAFHYARYFDGVAKASDDLDEVKWFHIEEIMDILHPVHHVLGRTLVSRYRLGDLSAS